MINITDEPTNNTCLKCDYNPEENEHKNILTDENKGICISCATDDNEIYRANKEIIDQHIKYDIEEGEFNEEENGWFTKGTFGTYSITFKTRQAEARKRIAVDDEKILGYYTELYKNGTVTILEPHNVKTKYDVSDSYTKENINEQRDEDARRRH